MDLCRINSITGSAKERCRMPRRCGMRAFRELETALKTADAVQHDIADVADSEVSLAAPRVADRRVEASIQGA